MSLGDLQRLSQAAAAYKRLFNLTDDGRNLEKADAVREMHAVINAMSANDVLSWIDTINPNNPVVGAYMRLDLARYFLDEFEKTRHTITANIYEYEDEIDPDVAIVGDFFDDFLPKYRDAIDRMVQRERTSPSMEDEKVLQRFIKRIDTFKQSPEEMRKFIESNVRELNPMPRMRRLRHLKANCPEVTIRIRLSNIIDEYKKQDIAAEVAQMRRVAAQPLTGQAEPTPEAQPSPTSGNADDVTPPDTSTIMELMLLDDEEQKQRLLNVLRNLVDGEKGKHVALVFLVCETHGLMRKPTHQILTSTFGDIGTKSGYNNYYSKGLSAYTQEQIKGIETHILPFVNGH